MAAAKSRCQALECVFTAAPSGALASRLHCLLHVYTNGFAGYLWDMLRVRPFMRSCCSGENFPLNDTLMLSAYSFSVYLQCLPEVITGGQQDWGEGDVLTALS